MPISRPPARNGNTDISLPHARRRKASYKGHAESDGRVSIDEPCPYPWMSTLTSSSARVPDARGGEASGVPLYAGRDLSSRPAAVVGCAALAVGSFCV